jgi:hypothetical protein
MEGVPCLCAPPGDGAQDTYLHEEQAHDEGATLAVAYLPVYQRVRLEGNDGM